MSKESKCSVCKALGIKIEDDFKEELTVLNRKKYCSKHYEMEMEKKTKCFHCNRSIIRKDGVSINIISRKKGEEVKSLKLFCSTECGTKCQEELTYKEDFIALFMKHHNIEDTTSVPKVVFIQMSNLMVKYEMSYKGMFMTLEYIILNNIKIERDNIWAVVNNYDRARAYYTDIIRRKREAEAMKDVVIETKYFTLPDKLSRKERLNNLLYLPDED